MKKHIKTCKCGNTINDLRPGTNLYFSQCKSCRKQTIKNFMNVINKMSSVPESGQSLKGLI